MPALARSLGRDRCSAPRDDFGRARLTSAACRRFAVTSVTPVLRLERAERSASAFDLVGAIGAAAGAHGMPTIWLPNCLIEPRSPASKAATIYCRP